LHRSFGFITGVWPGKHKDLLVEFQAQTGIDLWPWSEKRQFVLLQWEMPRLHGHAHINLQLPQETTTVAKTEKLEI